MSDGPPSKRSPGESLSFDFSQPAPSSARTASWPPAYPSAASEPRVSTEHDERPRPQPPADEGPRVLSVAELGRVLRGAIERSVPRPIWVEGEVVGARPAPSGHLYFTLKDAEEDAALDVVIYKANLTQRMRSIVRDGARLRLRGRPAFWSARGRLQFAGDRLELAGRGAILEAIERLKEKLAAEGLFAPERKRSLPKDPRTIGVVTSAGGAVIHDICKVAARRGGAHVLLAPARVQGAGAAESITRSLELLQRIPTVDVIIAGRGGGSFDELLVWSDEILVRAVAASRVPVVSAVGHEVDVTLTDFAADARAATPSQAAEMTVPDRAATRRELKHLVQRLRRAVEHRLGAERMRLSEAQRRVADPRLAIASQQQTLDDRTARIGEALHARLRTSREAHGLLAARLAQVDPRAVLARERAELVRVRERIATLAARRLMTERGELARLAAGLDAMSPLQVLSRGYAIASKEGRAVRDAAELTPGDEVTVRVARGQFDARVEVVVPPEERRE
ncbi:MAG TPA: exodeoxyribonuclease VII large subunit [Polyangiaceae bacterium]|nr:exodeoxyribonuclease VII large subunit [Polyangiaceae bacterium]